MRKRARFLVIGQDNPQAFLRQARKLGIDEQLTIEKGRTDIPDILQAADFTQAPCIFLRNNLELMILAVAQMFGHPHDLFLCGMKNF